MHLYIGLIVKPRNDIVGANNIYFGKKKKKELVTKTTLLAFLVTSFFPEITGARCWLDVYRKTFFFVFSV